MVKTKEEINMINKDMMKKIKNYQSNFGITTTYFAGGKGVEVPPKKRK